MNLKKMNAVCGLLAIILMLAHVIYQIVAYILFLYNPLVTKILAWLTMGVVLLHVALAMGILMFRTEGSTLSQYPKQNRRTILQRGSAIGAMVLLILHTLSYSFLMSGTAIGQAGAMLVQVLFFAAVFTHVVTSFSNAFITLGLLSSPQTKKRIDLAAYVVCGLGFAVSSVVVIRTYLLLLAMH